MNITSCIVSWTSDNHNNVHIQSPVLQQEHFSSPLKVSIFRLTDWSFSIRRQTQQVDKSKLPAAARQHHQYPRVSLPYTMALARHCYSPTSHFQLVPHIHCVFPHRSIHVVRHPLVQESYSLQRFTSRTHL